MLGGMGIWLICPADLEVVDPDGLLINKQSIEIPGAIYGEDDVDGNNDMGEWIYIPTRKTGDYVITVIPEPNAESTDTYTLEVLAGDTTTVLAENVQISDIPDGPYIIESTEAGLIDKTTPTEPIPEFSTIAIPV